MHDRLVKRSSFMLHIRKSHTDLEFLFLCELSYNGTVSLLSRTNVEYVSGLRVSNNKGVSSPFIFKLDVHPYSICSHTTAYITKTIPKGVHYNCYCLSFSTNQSSIAVVKKESQFQPLFIHIVSYVVKIYICHLALKS